MLVSANGLCISLGFTKFQSVRKQQFYGIKFYKQYKSGKI